MNKFDMIRMHFEMAANECALTYGSPWDEEEDYFICPECNEPLYLEDHNTIKDWKNVINSFEDIDDSAPTWSFCPVCGFDFRVNFEEDNDNY